MKIKVASLFSGIGGFEEGMRMCNVDFDIVFSSEIDKFAKLSYLANFEHSNLHGDIKCVDEVDIPDHDILLGGFPCQAFSIAGKQKGFDDVRGTLFFDVCRVLHEKKPKLVLLENVKNLVSHDNSNTIRVILKKLNELGYTVDFDVINSNEAGLPQNRERTYIVGVYQGLHEPFNLFDCRNNKIAKLKYELNGDKFKGFNFFMNVKFNNQQMFIKDILDSKSNDLSYLKIENDCVNTFLNNIEIDYSTSCCSNIIKLFDLPKNVWNDLERQRRVYSIYGISPTVLARSDSAKIMIYDERNNKYFIRKLSPIENLRLQGCAGLYYRL